MLFRIILIFLPGLLIARPGFFEPWGKDTDLRIPEEHLAVSAPHLSPLGKLAELAISLHQNVLTHADGPRSHFRPSSSQYMREAIYKHGFFAGFIMGCDRLLRENGDPWVYRTILVNGKLFKSNPPP